MAGSTPTVPSGATTCPNPPSYPPTTPTSDSLPPEIESAAGGGSVMGRAEASNEATLLLQDGESATLPFSVSADGAYGFLIRYSNDNAGALENVTVLVDGTVVGVFQPADTGDDGEGWNMFADSQALGPARLTAGPHELTFAVAGGDGYSVELDVVRSA